MTPLQIGNGALSIGSLSSVYRRHHITGEEDAETFFSSSDGNTSHFEG